MQAAAERLGYIIIASNNSRNGPLAPAREAANAMWKDAHARFSLDPRRTYFAGFSGGARLAVSFAIGCKGCASGVAASGAGFPEGVDPKSVPRFPYFIAVGHDDFNYVEFSQLEPRLKDAHFTYHIRHFDGVHQWAPADVWFEAFDWFDLQAMRSGALPKDDQRVLTMYTGALTRASDQLGKHNDLEAYRIFSQAANDFAELTNTSEAQHRSAEMEKSQTVKDAIKHERHELDQQGSMAQAISAAIEALRDPVQVHENLSEVNRLFAELKKHAQSDTDPLQRIAKIVRSQGFGHAYETGEEMILLKDYPAALALYDAMINNAQAAPGAHLQKARIYILTNAKSKALEEIRLAVKEGATDPDNFDEPEFASLKSDPDFQAILHSLPPAKPE